ncbi:MAG: glycosyltransferase [Fluviicoccus sp.]|uniref:glycosyltransferase n=1 Tax=Fluviicoccus sp. TaxID=2003552 RepID=UPI00271DCD6E|nr:glycosyltransferase [Fluviicoccus sp.]MDO8330190.1 glycosyltransferase [Fluviicoccus sp.]
MNVLHYSKFYPPVFGGIEKVAFDLVEGMVKNGVTCDVLCFNSDRSDITEQSASGYRIIRTGIFATLASTPLSLANIRQFVRMADDYDVIHIHMPNPVANLAVFLARPKKARIVLHWHSDIVKQKTILKLYDPLQQWLLRRADAVIATSPPYAESSPWLQAYAEKVAVIPLGVDVSGIPSDPLIVDEIKREYGGRKLVFSLGRLVYYKGFDYLIDAASRLPDDVAVVIGGIGELEGALREKLASLKLENKVYLIGGIPFKKLGAYFKACDVFCLPSLERSEAYGVVQMEAMYFGKPVVSTSIPGSGVGWVNENNVSGQVVPPGDSLALSNSLDLILRDESLRLKLGEGARRRYDELFVVDKMVGLTVDLYQKVL